MKARTSDMTKGMPLKVISYFAVSLFIETLFMQAMGYKIAPVLSAD